jgi:hypothetical protein
MKVRPRSSRATAKGDGMDKTDRGRRKGGVVLGIGAVLMLAAAPVVTAHETMDENPDGTVVLADDWSMSEVEDLLANETEDAVDGMTDASPESPVASPDDSTIETEDAAPSDDANQPAAEQDDPSGQGPDEGDDSGGDSSGGDGGGHADD